MTSLLLRRKKQAAAEDQDRNDSLLTQIAGTGLLKYEYSLANKLDSALDCSGDGTLYLSNSKSWIHELGDDRQPKERLSFG